MMKKRFLLRMSILLSLLGYSPSGWAQLVFIDLIRELSQTAIRQLNEEIESQQTQIMLAQWAQRNREQELHRQSLAMVAEEREKYMSLERQRFEALSSWRMEMRGSMQFKSLVLRLEALVNKHRQLLACLQGDRRITGRYRQTIQSRLLGLSSRAAEATVEFRILEGRQGVHWTDGQRMEAVYALHQRLDGLYREYQILEWELRAWLAQAEQEAVDQAGKYWFHRFPQTNDPKNN